MQAVNITFNTQIYILQCWKNHYGYWHEKPKEDNDSKITHDPHVSHAEVCILMLQKTHLLETQGICALEMVFYVMKDKWPSHGL